MEINHSLTGGLGVVPNDFQIAFHRPYLPVMHGWIYDGKTTYKDGNLGSPIVHTMGLGSPIAHTQGLGTAGIAAALGISDDDVAKIVKAEQLRANMAVISTIAFVLGGIAAIYGVLKK